MQALFKQDMATGGCLKSLTPKLKEVAKSTESVQKNSFLKSEKD